LVLTAQHCVAPAPQENIDCGRAPFEEAYATSSIFISADTVLDRESLWFPVADVRLPPGGNDICGFDLALLVLSGNLPKRFAEPIVPRVDAPVTVGESYTAVGYGVTRDASAGVRRRQTGLSVECGADACGSHVTEREWIGDTSVCQGDSGGPALDDAGRVIGVASRGSGECRTPIYASTAAWASWIRSVAAEAAAFGAYDPAAWVTTGTSTGAGQTPDVESEADTTSGLEADELAPAPLPDSGTESDDGGCTTAPARQGRGSALLMGLLFALWFRSWRRQGK
jgi:hypothetical protein